MRQVVVAAHPDDEILWLSSAMEHADPVVLCYGAPYGKPEKAEARARAVAALKLPHLVNLVIPESGCRLLVDWQNPVLTPTGMAIAEGEAKARYEANFITLVEKLHSVLAGADAVYTHNPWGEYGHPEHIQVYRAVAALQKDLGFTIWFSNYMAPLTLPLIRRLAASPLWAEKRLVVPDVRLARRLRAIYLRHRVWTWSFFHRWPATETLYAQPPGGHEGWHSLEGETLVDATKLRWWRGDSAARWMV
ncbi:MAG: PIG-L family deacetylase [Rhodospirillales bacterium]|nr:PIG-L family deacetylase [Rhodospirillales bacterium]MDE2318507.1 PIG-L family deacetylase [Rhodospirillales bacterium]